MWRTRGGHVLLAAIAIAAGLLAPASASAASAHDLLPDLRMAHPQDFHLDTSASPGHTLLEFSAIIQNVGAGPLEVHGTRTCRTCTTMTTQQFIRRSDGTWRHRNEAAVQRFATGDGHHHWHVIGMERYQILGLQAPLPGGVVVSAKNGFCFFDGLQVAPKLTHAAPYPHYSFFDCGTPTSQKTRVGLSVGWGDIYPWNFAGQNIDITGLPDGDYLVCATADPSNNFLESHEGNNQGWAKITLTGATVTVNGTGRTRCQGQLPYTIANG